MCAAVPSTPVVVILPLTDLSDETLKVPVPDAVVLTGGTSSSPVSLTLTPPSRSPAVVEQPLKISNPMTEAAASIVQNRLLILFIYLPPCLRVAPSFTDTSTTAVYLFHFAQQLFRR